MFLNTTGTCPHEHRGMRVQVVTICTGVSFCTEYLGVRCGLHTSLLDPSPDGGRDRSEYARSYKHTRLKYGSHMKGLTTPSPTITPHPNLQELNKKSKLLKKDGYKAQGTRQTFVTCRHIEHCSLLCRRLTISKQHVIKELLEIAQTKLKSVRK